MPRQFHKKHSNALTDILKLHPLRGRHSQLYNYLMNMINRIRVRNNKLYCNQSTSDIKLLMKHIKVTSKRAYFIKFITFKNLPICSETIKLMNDNSHTRLSLPHFYKKFMYSDKKSESKQTNNDYFAATIREHINRPQNILLLDGVNMFSTKTIIKSKLKYDNIIIVESNYETYLTHRESKKCMAYHGRLEDFTKEISNNEILSKTNCAYLDYTGTIEGRYSGKRSKHFYPLEIIHNLLTKTSSSTFVLGLTVTLRSHRGIFNDKSSLEDQIIEDFVKPCIAYCQFRIEQPMIKYSYNRGGVGAKQQMLFMCLVLQKDTSIDITQIRFVIDKVMIDGKYQQICLGYDPYKWKAE